MKYLYYLITLLFFSFWNIAYSSVVCTDDSSVNPFDNNSVKVHTSKNGYSVCNSNNSNTSAAKANTSCLVNIDENKTGNKDIYCSRPNSDMLGELTKKISNSSKSKIENIVTIQFPNADKIKNRKLSAAELKLLKKDPDKFFISILKAYNQRSNEIEKLTKAVKFTQTLYELNPDELKKNTIAKKDDFVESLNDIETAEDLLNAVHFRCSVKLSDDPVVQMLTKVSGGDFLQNYEEKKAVVCDGVHKLYQLKVKLEQLQKIREDGVSLMYKHTSTKKSFPGDRKRTIQFSLDLRYYPDVQQNYQNGTIDPTFSIDNERSWFKWSDENKIYIADMIEAAQDSGGDVCEDSKPLWFKLSSRISAKIKIADANEESIDIAACAKFKGFDSTKTITFPTVTIPAPFGYMAEVTEMKDEAMQDLTKNLQSALLDLLGVDLKFTDTIEAIEDIKKQKS